MAFGWVLMKKDESGYQGLPEPNEGKKGIGTGFVSKNVL
jgi:hypothetical protein